MGPHAWRATGDDSQQRVILFQNVEGPPTWGFMTSSAEGWSLLVSKWGIGKSK